MEAKKEAAVAASAARELAMRIYIELVGRNTAFEGSAVKLPTSADNLARLSLKLADAFYAADLAVETAKAPKVDFKLDASNIAEWSK